MDSPPSMPEGKELRAAVRRVLDLKRDAELRGREVPLLKLSWVQRQERRAKSLLLVLLFGIYPLSQFAAIVALRPLVLRNPWYASVLIAWAIVSPLVVFGWGWPKIYRWYSLVCPYCGAMVSVQLPTLSEKSVERGTDAALPLVPSSHHRSGSIIRRFQIRSRQLILGRVGVARLFLGQK